MKHSTRAAFGAILGGFGLMMALGIMAGSAAWMLSDMPQPHFTEASLTSTCTTDRDCEYWADRLEGK